MLDWLLYAGLALMFLIFGARKLKRWLTYVPPPKEKPENKN